MGSQVVLATAGYDHTIRFWEATSGICYRTLQYADSQVRIGCFFFFFDATAFFARSHQSALFLSRFSLVSLSLLSPFPIPIITPGQQARDHGG
jgi:hypothetical protein